MSPTRDLLVSAEKALKSLGIDVFDASEDSDEIPQAVVDVFYTQNVENIKNAHQQQLSLQADIYTEWDSLGDAIDYADDAQQLLRGLQLQQYQQTNNGGTVRRLRDSSTNRPLHRMTVLFEYNVTRTAVI